MLIDAGVLFYWFSLISGQPEQGWRLINVFYSPLRKPDVGGGVVVCCVCVCVVCSVCVCISSKVKMKPRPQQRGGLKSPCIQAHRSQKL